MRAAAIALTTSLVLASGSFGPANADSEKAPLVPGYEAARDLPGARELPDPKTDYKVVFADGQDAKNPGDVNPMLPTIATYVNTLIAHGLTISHLHEPAPEPSGIAAHHIAARRRVYLVVSQRNG